MHINIQSTPRRLECYCIVNLLLLIFIKKKTPQKWLAIDLDDKIKINVDSTLVTFEIWVLVLLDNLLKKIFYELAIQWSKKGLTVNSI